MLHRMQAAKNGCGKNFRRNKHKLFITLKGIWHFPVVFIYARKNTTYKVRMVCRAR